MLQVTWGTYGNNAHWCDLQLLDLTGSAFSNRQQGVYIIWYDADPAKVVRVGQGILADRLHTHRNDPQITKYAANGTLRVTWAVVTDQYQRDGVERYLAEHYKPLVGERYPNVLPLSVNLP